MCTRLLRCSSSAISRIDSSDRLESGGAAPATNITVFREVSTKLIWILPLWGLLFAESALIASPQKAVLAHWRETPITIDGQLDEPAWAVAEPVWDFVQVEPREGDPPTERTEVRVLFDDEKLYIGVYLYVSAPGQILTNDLQRDFETR